MCVERLSSFLIYSHNAMLSSLPLRKEASEVRS